MPLIINFNNASMSAQNYLSKNTSALQNSMEKLASGYRINHASDDAAGLGLSENLRSQIRGDQKALANTQDGINVMNIADGAMQTITDNLQRMRELAVQAANDTYSTTQRTSMQTEYDQLASGITQIAKAVQFNGIHLLDGTSTIASLQIGANTSANVDDFTVSSLFVDTTAGNTGLNVDTQLLDSHANALNTITSLDTALTTLNTNRGNLGASINRLQSTSTNLSTMVTNTAASESQIRNVDVAMESANLSKNQILQQAATAMLAQANQAPQLALNLLK